MNEVVAPHVSSHEALPGARPGPPAQPVDPWGWTLAIAAAFAVIAGWRLTTPGIAYFDEVHYLPAARDILAMWTEGGGTYINREHPLFAKTLMAIGMAVFGDNPFGWRIMPLLAGVLAIWASCRAMWHASLDRFATLAFGVLIVTGFHLFIHARLAMLDIFMVAFLALAAWQFAAACREPETGRRRLAIAGVAIGLALGSKWNAVPLAMAFGITFFIARLSAGRRRLFTSKRGIPVPGVSLLEAFVWLGIVPLAVYAATFLPGYWLGSEFHPSPLAQNGLIGLHHEILALQQQVLEPHAYQSNWHQWVLNARGIWYLYEEVDGAQRGVLLIGNPLTMLIGLPALVWCAVRGAYDHDWAKLGAVGGFLVTLGLWLVAPKPVQFYYHYILPSTFLLAALAISLSDLRAHGHRWLAWGTLAASAGVFALFYKIIAAAPLDGPMSFAHWAWIAGWR